MSLSGSILLCCSGLFDIYIFFVSFSLSFHCWLNFVLAIGYSHENVLYKVLTQNISGIVTDHVKFYP